MPLTLVAYSLASVLAFPSLGLASGAKSKQAIEHESVEVEHRTTQEKQNLEHDALPDTALIPDEHKEVQQQVTKEHREVHRDVVDHDKESHHDD